MDKPIIFLDSGVGGLQYLFHARRKLPHENFIHIADRENFPYGEKTSRQIISTLIPMVRRAIERFDPKALVVACNTASVVALPDLRRNFNLPVLGVVPAVKPAARISKTKHVGVIATSQTIRDGYLDDLIRDHAGDCTVVKIAASNLVRFVEQNFIFASTSERLNVVGKVLTSVSNNSIDVVILACTHFVVLDREFKKILGPNIRVIDSREGVIRQLVHVLNQNKIKCSAGAGSATLYLSGRGEPEPRYKAFAGYYNLEFGGLL